MKQIDDVLINNIIVCLINSIPCKVTVGTVNELVGKLQGLKDIEKNGPKKKSTEKPK